MTFSSSVSEGVGDGVYAGCAGTYSGKFCSSMPSVATCMKSVHARAGHDPPVICSYSPKGSIGAWPERMPSSRSSFSYCRSPTTVVSCGTKPANHAERLFCEVPVLPATGRPSSWAVRPEPSSTTLVIAWVAAVVTSASNSFSWSCGPSYSVVPSSVSTFATTCGDVR